MSRLTWYWQPRHDRLQMPNAKSQTEPYEQTRHYADKRCRMLPAEGLVVDSPQERGVPPFPYIPPKIVDPPQEECGPQGVEESL